MDIFLILEVCYIQTSSLIACFFLQVFAKGIDKDVLILMAARASRIENQDGIDAAIVGVLADPKEVNKFSRHGQVY